MAGESHASIRIKFSKIFLFMLIVVMVLGSFSAWRLTDYRTFSDELRDRFFRSTQFLGDINNYTSDFRTIEGTYLLSNGARDAAPGGREFSKLDDEITFARRQYEKIAHDPAEGALYQEFVAQWLAYRRAADRVLRLAHERRTQAANALYVSVSQADYDLASDTLGRLTDLNVKEAARAAQRADSAFHETRALTAAAMLVAGLMVAAGLAYMRRSITDPLIDLAQAMDDLARGKFDIDIHGAGRSDEIGGMARAVEIFRRNAIDLAVGQEVLADHASVLAYKLAEEQQLTQRQRDFVTMASHEFRTPLSIIDGQAQRLISAKNRLAGDEVLERAGNIRRAVLRITSMMDHLIEHARLAEKGPDTLFKPTQVNLTELLRDVCRLHRELVPSAVILEDFDAQPAMLTGDRRLLSHLFSNLISNGIKYSDEQARLKVGLTSSDDETIVVIADNGIGISEEDQKLVYERFFRGKNTEGKVGTGIGLYLVKTVVDLHNGVISLESQVNAGSRFEIRLPKRQTASRRALSGAAFMPTRAD